MMKVKRLNGSELYVNPELILSIEETPDTVIVMTNGERFIVTNSAAEIVESYLQYRSNVFHGVPAVVKLS